MCLIKLEYDLISYTRTRSKHVQLLSIVQELPMARRILRYQPHAEYKPYDAGIRPMLPLLPVLLALLLPLLRLLRMEK